MRDAIVGYSFGSVNSKSNKDLAKAINSIAKGKFVVVQWELAGHMKTRPSFIVRQTRDYLGTEEVTEQAAVFLRKKNVTKVFVVAQPFLHRSKCITLMKKEGFHVVAPDIGRISFDPMSSQWWTRNKVNFFIYAVLQILTGRRGR